MDVLAEVLGSLAMRGVLLTDHRNAAPWGIRLDTVGTAGFHWVIEGDCWLRVGARTPRRLQQGDLVLIPRGVVHELADAPDSHAIPLAEFIERGRPKRQAKAATRVVCGAYRYDEHRPQPLFSLLPPVLHFSARDMQREEGLRATLRLLHVELEAQEPGRSVLVDRLVDALLIYVLRAWLSKAPEGRTGWLGALRDPQVGRAVALIHGSPATRWTVEDLAAAVAMSRAVFARRFTELVGMPPLAYLTRWRLDLALRKLESTSLSVAAIAHDVGYESEFAFSRAFKRTLGKSPSHHRRASEPARASLPNAAGA